MEEHDHQLEQCQVLQESAQQREAPTERESRRVTNAARQQASCLNMPTEDTVIRRSANAH